ncbi:MAG TPA: hypothetical protein VMD09_15450 [Solirubrobacteraceae bacterium]|nr:hypothetical protein [Solirubrobacteraceae bacterium]
MTGSSHAIPAPSVPRLPAARRAVTALLVVLLGLLAAKAAFAGPLRGLTGTPAAPSSPWSVALAGSRGGAVSPGQSSQLLAYRVTNAGQGAVAHLHASVATDPATGDVLNPSGAVIVGCLGRWFKATPATGAAGLPVPAGGSAQAWVRLSMINAPVNQDACRGADVAVKLTAS